MRRLLEAAVLCAVGTLFVLSQGCATANKSEAARVADEPTAEEEHLDLTSGGLQIIDSHTHTEFVGKNEPITGIPMTREQYFKEFKDANVVGAIAHTHQGQNDYFDLRAHRVIHCVGAKANPDYAEMERGLKSGKYGCVKVYLGYIHQFASDPRYRRIYKLAETYDVPVVFHTGDTYSTKGKLKYADPLTIDDIAVDYPNVKFVLAHIGNPWIQSAAEVAYKNPNVYLDGSALLIGDMDKLPREKVDEYVVKPLAWVFGYLEDPKKLMFGSDWPLNNIASYVKAFKRAIPKEHWKAVFHDNAAAVFHFDRKGRPVPPAGGNANGIKKH